MAAAEFALVMPLLLLFTFGIIQYGAMFFVYNNMSNAAREAARALAVGEDVTKAQAQARANQFLVGWPATWVIDAENPSTAKPGYVWVKITVPGSEAGILSFAPAPSLLQTEVFMRKE